MIFYFAAGYIVVGTLIAAWGTFWHPVMLMQIRTKADYDYDRLRGIWISLYGRPSWDESRLLEATALLTVQVSVFLRFLAFWPYILIRDLLRMM